MFAHTSIFSFCTFFFVLFSSGQSTIDSKGICIKCTTPLPDGVEWFTCDMHQLVSDAMKDIRHERNASNTYYHCVGKDNSDHTHALILPDEPGAANLFPSNTQVAITQGTSIDIQPPDSIQETVNYQPPLPLNPDGTVDLSPPTEAVHSTLSLFHTSDSLSMRGHPGYTGATVLYNTTVVIAVAEKRRARRQEEVAGPRSVLLLRVEYNGFTPDYCDEACATAAITEVDDVYREMSSDTVRFLPSMAQVKTITIADGKYGASGCMFSAIAEEANAAAAASGVNPKDFQHTVYYLPSEFEQSQCTFGGLAYHGCTAPDCKVWVRTEEPATLALELGHNVNAKYSAAEITSVMDNRAKIKTVAPVVEEEKDEEDTVHVHTDTVNQTRSFEANHVTGTSASNGTFTALIALVCIAAVVVGIIVLRNQHTEHATIDISAGHVLVQSPETTIAMVV